MENQKISGEEKYKNCEILDSWEVLKAQESDEVGEVQRNTSEIIHQSEDSDGISVISESELYKTISENEMEKDEETATEEKLEAAEEFHPLTPPATPTTEVEEEQCFIHNNQRNFIFIAGLFAIVAILYSHINSLKNDIQNCDQRIRKLEEENQLLKAAFDQLKKSSKTEVDPGIEFINAEELLLEINEENRSRMTSLYEDKIGKSPPTKTVWFGSGTEHKVEILDKKHELPDYCYHTEEDDLFFEYNQEICEQKRRKLTAKESKKKPLKRQWNVESYDDFIQETLKSLDDEIQEIKRKRTEKNEETEENVKVSSKKQKKTPKTFEYLKKASEDFNNPNNVQDNLGNFNEKPQFSPSESFSEKPAKPKRKKPKRKDRNWLEDRMNGREKARKTHEKEKEIEENWFLKRKNERELDRLQK